ncbi:LysR family transcriptional regulator [Kribbella capetownensis]|uniref:LysR family transcriptional regulator n=1 Tax=Kribbella capetownensis TaxID=1572659 RepID=A0A4R0JUA2_9ACTN|nr:LysR family substrate-binding domain-containing protein [Kribbella capetownensis]TCC48746.1 LysR family transcriptional regulator [Kribbella capetownensis]
MTGPRPTFRLGYVPGVTPAKWVRMWAERLPRIPLELIQVTAAEAPALVRRGEADAVLLRLPIDRDGLHAIPLYVEQTVVVVPKDHLVTAADEVTTDDLAGELMLYPQDDVFAWERPPGRVIDERPPTTADAIALVAMGTGLLVVPQSLARLHHRKDLTYRPLLDAPESQVALCWPEDETSELVEQFIGIVRGRTVNSSRGAQPAAKTPTGKTPAKKAPVKKAPAKKALAKGAGKRTGRPRRR